MEMTSVDSVFMYCAGIIPPSDRHLIADSDHTYQELNFLPPPIPPRIKLQLSPVSANSLYTEPQPECHLGRRAKVANVGNSNSICLSHSNVESKHLSHHSDSEHVEYEEEYESCPSISLSSKQLSHNSDSEEEEYEYETPDLPNVDAKVLYEEAFGPPYEERVIRHKSAFLSKLTVPHILPHLHPVLDDAALATINNTGKYVCYSSAAEVLLQKLKESANPIKWEVFIEALKASGHSTLARVMESDAAYAEDDDMYEIVREFKPQLRELITPQELLPHLVASNVMTPEDADQIRKKETDKGQRAAADLLLDRIHRKHPNWFKEFLHACKSIKHDDLIQLLHHAETRSNSCALLQEKTQVAGTKFSSVTDTEGETHKEESARSQEVKTRDAGSSPRNIAIDDYEEPECLENITMSARLDESAETKSTETDKIYREIQLYKAKQEEYKKEIALYKQLKKERQECERLHRLAAACKLEAEEHAFLERKDEVDDS